MYRTLELILHKDTMALFQFLKDNPTQAYRQGDYFKLLYIQPIGAYVTPFSLKNVRVNVTDQPNIAEPWQLIRDLPQAWADADLMAVLSDLEAYHLKGQRQGLGLDLSGFVFDCIAYGLNSQEDTERLVKLMFCHGYDMEQVIALFSAIVRRKSLARPFLTLAIHLYKGVA